MKNIANSGRGGGYSALRTQKLIKTYEWFALILFGIAYYFLICQFVPFWDDVYYRFVIREVPQTVDNFQLLFHSAINGYNYMNGRLLNHLLDGWFNGYGGEQLFFIVSSFVFVGWIASSLAILRLLSKRAQLYDIFLLVVLFFLLLPVTGFTIIGNIAFVTNYMYSLFVYTWFLLVYLIVKQEKVQKWYVNICLLVFGILCGMMQESFAIGIGATLLIYHIITFKRYYKNPTLVCLVVGFGIGASFLIFAPSNFHRFFVHQSPDNAYPGMTLYSIVQLFKHYAFIDVYFFLIVVSLLIDLIKHKQPIFIMRYWFLVFPCLVAFLFVLFVAFGGVYQLTMLAAFTVILLVLFVRDYIPQVADLMQYKWLHYSFTCLLVLLICICYPDLYQKRQYAYEGWQEFEQLALERKSSIAIAPKYEYANYHGVGNSFWRSYTPFAFGKYLPYDTGGLLSLYLTHAQRSDIALTIIPEDVDTIVKYCDDDNNRLSEGLYMSPKIGYMIAKIPASIPIEQINDYYTIEMQLKAITLIDKFKDLVMHRDYVTSTNNTLEPSVDIDMYIARSFVSGDYRYVAVFSKEIIARELLSARLVCK